MSSIRKIKRRAMARLSEPVVQIKIAGELLGKLNTMTSIQRDQLIRQAIRSYVAAHRRER